MSLVKKYEQLNKVALELVETIRLINEEYLKRDINDIQYPYDEVSKLANEFDLKYKKLFHL